MYLGDFTPGKTIHRKFTTVSAGVPTALAGTPAISVYKDNSTTQSTAGVTLTVSFDSVTGMNHVAIDTSADGTFYSAGSDFQIVITTGTVAGSSVVGYAVGAFSLANRSSLRPTTADRTLDVSATGEAGVDWANIGAPTTSQTLSGTTVGTATIAGTVNGLAANVITATSIATDAITAAKIAADAIGASELAQAAADKVWASTTRTLSNPAGIQKNVAYNNFTFLLVLSSDHVNGAPGKTVTATRSIDGAAFAACANTVSEVASGIYKINLAATDVNGDNIVLRFTATSCDDRFVSIVTEP